MTRLSIIITIVVPFFNQHVTGLPKLGCFVSVNEHLSDPQPLILRPNATAVVPNEAFYLPADNFGTLIFERGEVVDLVCPGAEVALNGTPTGKLTLKATCNTGIWFKLQNTISVPFNSITCTKHPYHTAKYTGKTCGHAKKHKEITVGFEINPKRFIPHLAICFDDVLQNVVYSESKITSAIKGFQHGYPRQSFIAGDFFHVQPDTVNYLYSRVGQRKTINKILGASPTNTSIIQETNNFFLARGHYAPKADFIFGAQQRLTFWYVNVAPQWQTFNGGNWNAMEQNSRDFASKTGLNLVVYTGSHGVCKLPDYQGVEKELYLWVNGSRKGIPVPELFYKVLYEPERKSGVVLVSVNNPYKKSDFNIVCKDVCDQIKWLTYWNRKNATLGYSYCCDVNEFRKIVDVLPDFEVKELLTTGGEGNTAELPRVSLMGYFLFVVTILFLRVNKM